MMGYDRIFVTKDEGDMRRYADEYDEQCVEHIQKYFEKYVVIEKCILSLLGNVLTSC